MDINESGYTNDHMNALFQGGNANFKKMMDEYKVKSKMPKYFKYKTYAAYYYRKKVSVYFTLLNV